jgi:hypothetical protein
MDHAIDASSAWNQHDATFDGRRVAPDAAVQLGGR